MIESLKSVWWNDIRGPQSFIRAITDGINDKKSIIVIVPEDLPWRKEMRSAVDQALPEINITVIDCQREFLNENSVADFILKKYANSVQANGYRHSSGMTIAEYISSKTVLMRRVLWIKGMSPEQCDAWLEFVEAFPVNNQSGLFVLEVYSEAKEYHFTNAIAVNYEKHVGFYDALMFNNIATSRTDFVDCAKSYIAMLVTQICDTDVELASHLICSENILSKDPVVQLESAFNSNYFLNRREAELIKSSHPFFLMRNNNERELTRRIWLAQLQTMFPLIEIERISLLEKFDKDIVEATQETYIDNWSGENVRVMQHNQVIEDLYDIEIGTIRFMLHRKRSDGTGTYLLYLQNQADRERVELLYKMRNKLAHLESCSVDEISEFIDNYPFSWGTRIT